MNHTKSERVDDLPVVIHWLSQMRIEELIDQALPAPHGNRQGLSYGQLAILLLSYIITQADHRLCAVESWVNQHHQTLELITGWKMRDKDATDDRLADLLSVLGSSQHKAIESIETFLGQHLIRAYSLPETALAKLASKPGQNAQTLQEKVDRLLETHRVKEYLNVTVNKQIRYPKVYSTPGRPTTGCSFRRVRQTTLTLTYQRQETALAEFHTLAGWRLYVTNAPPERLSLQQSVFYYRQQWQPERGFHLFKRGRLPALPIYFQDEQRIRGLMFLLTLALRVFTLMEFVVRRQLSDQQQSLAGLYDGNPKRTTNRPTAERLLRAFCGISLYFHRDGSTEISPLNCLQQQVLKFMGFPESIYTLPSLAPE